MIEFIDTSNDELEAMAQGCSEQTCLYHGRVNVERARRRRVAVDPSARAEGGATS